MLMMVEKKITEMLQALSLLDYTLRIFREVSVFQFVEILLVLIDGPLTSSHFVNNLRLLEQYFRISA